MSVNDLMISLDRAQLAEVESLLAHIKNGANRAFIVGVNRTANAAAGSSRRRLVPLMGLKLKDVTKQVKVKRLDKMSRMLRFMNFNIQAVKRPRRPSQSEEFAFTKTGEVFPSLPAMLFKQEMPESGHVGYFVRSLHDESKKTPRLPMQELRIPSPRKALESSPQILEEELKKAHQKLQENVLSQVDRLLNRRKVDR